MEFYNLQLSRSFCNVVLTEKYKELQVVMPFAVKYRWLSTLHYMESTSRDHFVKLTINMIIKMQNNRFFYTKNGYINNKEE